jgi:hypothetical protein
MTKLIKDDAAFLADSAERIRALGRRVIDDVIEIGRLLVECKARCGHGNWLPWIEREFGWSDDTALNFIRCHQLAKSRNFRDLSLPVTSLYLLAKPSTTESARDEVFARAGSGERLKHAEVQAILTTYSPDAIQKAATAVRAETFQARDDARKAALFAPTGEIVASLHVGRFQELSPRTIPAESVELVFTDPPYDGDSVPLYSDAAKEAARILKPGGSLFIYSGHVHLRAAMNAMAEHLNDYHPCASLSIEGPHARMFRKGVEVLWKPLLWFVKGHRGDIQTFVRDVVSGPREKDFHEWQQSLSDATYYIEKLTSPDGTVVDFFVGGGTTLVAAKRLGRRWIGFEIDPAIAERASQRITATDAKLEAAE